MEVMKMAVIHELGKSDYIMDDISNDTPHILLMLDYIKQNYSDDEYLMNCDRYTAINKIAMYLSTKGEIVYLNTTSYKEGWLEEYGTSGILLMPKRIREEQVYDLFKLKDKIQELQELQIWHDIKDNGKAQMKMGDANIINDYLKGKRFVKRKK